jgi:hypothetical protein
MSVLSYDNRTLIGNWQEDRLHGRRLTEQQPHGRVHHRDMPAKHEGGSEAVSSVSLQLGPTQPLPPLTACVPLLCCCLSVSACQRVVRSLRPPLSAD